MHASKLQVIAGSLVLAGLLAVPASNAGQGDEPRVPKPAALLTVWRLSILSKQHIASGETRLLANAAVPANEPSKLEDLLPGSKPQVSRFPMMILQRGGWTTLDFPGSDDLFAGYIDESSAVSLLRLRIHTDGKELPEVVIQVEKDLTGGGLVLVGAPDGTEYVVGATMLLM